MPGIEPGAFRMQSEHSTTELHPRCINERHVCIDDLNIFPITYRSTVSEVNRYRRALRNIVEGSRGPNNANHNIVRQIAKFGIIAYCKIIINI